MGSPARLDRVICAPGLVVGQFSMGAGHRTPHGADLLVRDGQSVDLPLLAGFSPQALILGKTLRWTLQ